MAFNPCPFCTVPAKRIVDQKDSAEAIRDGFPESPGHTLAIPKRYFGSFFELDDDEVNSLIALLKTARANLDNELNPGSYNIGINDGSEAGQTMPHVHIHLIFRYAGVVKDPKGGVRWLIPEKANSWEMKGDD